LIPINYESSTPTVNARDLHAALKVVTPYKDWLPRMCRYGFMEGKDFSTILRESTGGRPSIDHEMTIAMAKELCMLQRSAMGRKFRRYFLECEQNWESPDQLMERAMKIAHQRSIEVDRRIMAEHGLPHELLALVEDHEPHDSFDHTCAGIFKEII
jgi:anti-repressor protein